MLQKPSLALVVYLAAFLGAPAAFAQPAAPTTQPAAEAPAAPAADDLAPPAEVRDDRPAVDRAGTDGQAARDVAEQAEAVDASGLAPSLGRAALTWIAVVIILMLFLRFTPLFAWRNLDALVLAGLAVVLLYRTNPTGAGTPSWVYLALTGGGLYWMLRGLITFSRSYVPQPAPNLVAASATVLTVASLFLAFDTLVRAPVTASSRDAVIGGTFFLETGYLPYGEVTALTDESGDLVAIDPGAASELQRLGAQSPLLYALHAGCVAVAELASGADVAVSQSDDSAMKFGPEQRERWWRFDDRSPGYRAALIANGFLVVVILGALLFVGARLHSPLKGAGIVAVLCVLPLASDVFNEPGLLLPAACLSLGLAFALVPVFGGLLSTAWLVFAGLAWPWIWLIAVVVAAWQLRRGWQAVGVIVGVPLGAAAALALLIDVVKPSMPTADAAIANAGWTPKVVATVEDGALRFESLADAEDIEAEASQSTGVERYLWRLLLRREAPMPEVESLSSETRFADVTPADRAAEIELNRMYQLADANREPVDRIWGVLRTTLESVWLPEELKPRATARGVWTVWGDEERIGDVTTIRRVVKAVAVALGVLAALIILFGGRNESRHLIGGVTIAVGATFLASWYGAATNWLWMLVAVLPLMVVHGGRPVVRAPRKAGSGSPKPGGKSAPTHPAPPAPASRPAPAPFGTGSASARFGSSPPSGAAPRISVQPPDRPKGGPSEEVGGR